MLNLAKCPECKCPVGPNDQACPACGAMFSAKEMAEIKQSAEKSAAVDRGGLRAGHRRPALVKNDPTPDKASAQAIEIDDQIKSYAFALSLGTCAVMSGIAFAVRNANWPGTASTLLDIGGVILGVMWVKGYAQSVSGDPVRQFVGRSILRGFWQGIIAFVLASIGLLIFSIVLGRT